MTTAAVEEYKMVLSVGDTTFLNYRSIKIKREGYGPTGNGGNGLILHSALAIEPEQGQTLGLPGAKTLESRTQAQTAQSGNSTAEKTKTGKGQKNSTEKTLYREGILQMGRSAPCCGQASRSEHKPD